jgi:SAM-dependent methyltransferase
MINDDYSKLEGYVPDADLNLGCGMPTELAGIKEGNTVVDLGSGAGNDVFISRSIVGETGKVIGIDFTPEMIKKANSNNEKLGYKNVNFHLGEIEQIPLDNSIADVVVSNCVLNLVPDKTKAFSEIFRILKPGAHFCVSDIVLVGDLPEKLQKSAAVYAGCVAGALQQEDYISTIKNAGFKNVQIKKTKTIVLPDLLLTEYLTKNEISDFKNSGMGIFSITVLGYKE